MTTLLDDPLYQTQNAAGLKLLNLYNPDQEAQRYQKALGNLKQTVAGRQAQSGLTGSSEEKDNLTNAASNFELGWAEREPDQLSKAITASNLPISNLLKSQDISLTGELGNRKLDQSQSALDYSKLKGLAGGAASLAKWLAGNGTDGTSNLASLLSTLGSGAKTAWDWITGSGSTPATVADDAGYYATPTDDWSWLTNSGSTAVPTDYYDYWLN